MAKEEGTENRVLILIISILSYHHGNGQIWQDTSIGVILAPKLWV